MFRNLLTPTALIFFGTALVRLAIMTIREYRMIKRRRPMHCSTCGYNLTGNASGTCPECGTTIQQRATGNTGKC